MTLAIEDVNSKLVDLVADIAISVNESISGS